VAARRRPIKAAKTPPPPRKLSGKLQVVYLPAAKLKPDPLNARIHEEENLDAIRASIDSLGVYGPILVQAKTKRIIAGHGRLAVFEERGIDPVPCILLKVDDARAREIALRDNRTAELAGWDGEKLAKVLDELDEQLKLSPLDLGFTDEDLDALIERAAGDEPADEPGDHTPPVTQFKVIVHCKDENDQADLLGRLKKQGYKCHSMGS
jgi:ParB-like chromosome segregation protein Spo0J